MSFDGNINLYLGKTVRVELEDDNALEGILDQDDEGFLVDDKRVDMTRVQDILYRDTMDMEDLVIKAGNLYTAKGLMLDRQELIQVVGEDFVCGEKEVDFVCHLYYNRDADKNAGKVCACDMRALRLAHVVRRDILEGNAFLYRIEHGPYIYATLNGEWLDTVDGQIEFDPEKITEITICPQQDTEVTVVFCDGLEVTSLVTSVSEKGLVLAEGYAGRIPYREIHQLRYRAKLKVRTDADGTRMEMCGNYRYRHRYLRHTDAYAFRDGLVADFTVGMTRMGLTCKDVILVVYDKRQEGYGVLSDYINTQGMGFVDPEYEYKTPCKKTYYVNSAALSKGWVNNDIDTNKYLYAVKFTHLPNDRHSNRAIYSMEIIGQYERSHYSSIRVDDQGHVQAELLETPEDMTGAIEEGYGFLYYYNGDEKHAGDAYISRQVKESGPEYEYYAYIAGYLAKCKGQALDTRKCCYLIRYWMDSRQPKTDKLPVVYKIEILEALPKGKAYHVNEFGAVTSYDPTEFKALNVLLNERVVIIGKDHNRYLGTLHSNDAENAQLTILFADATELTLSYAHIMEVWGLGVVTRYYEDSTYGFIQAGGRIYYKNSTIQSDLEPKLERGQLVGFRLAHMEDGVQATLVRPLTETQEAGYVTADNKNGGYQVIAEDVYGTVEQVHTAPETIRLQNPNLKFPDLAGKDYKVQLHNLRFTEGTWLLRGIEKHLGACNKIFFGCADKFCDNPKGSGKFAYGFLKPLDAATRAQQGESLYFRNIQNSAFFSQVVEPGDNPNKADPCLVTYQVAEAPKKPGVCAVSMNSLGRYSRAWFDQVMYGEQAAVTESVSAPAVKIGSESLKSKIHSFVEQNDVLSAKNLLKEYAEENGGEDDFYYMQLHSIFMKEYKHNHTQEVRRGWLECIRQLRKTLDRTEQYGLRLDVLYKQANLTMEERRVSEALRLYREWQQLLEEFCAIYPDKKKNYKNFMDRVDEILKTEVWSQGDEYMDNESGPSGPDLHAYLEWRVDAASENENEDLWAKARSLREQSDGNEYVEALKAAVKAELAGISGQRLRHRAHFAFLDLMLDPRDDADALLPYFADALREDGTFAGILGQEGFEPDPDAEVVACSRFTLDSLILVAMGRMDVRSWLDRFTNDTLRRRYIRELYCLVDKQAERFDMEQLETVFNEAMAKLQQPVDGNLPIHQYAAEVLRRTELLRHCGVVVSGEVDAVLRDLKEYVTRKGFSARMGCLRDNATKLQAYNKSIRQNPTVHDWNLLWPICARLIGQIQRTWHTLLEIFVPSIEFGTPQAVRESPDTWKVTVPLRNNKNAQHASYIKFSGFEASPENPKKLIGDGVDHAFVIKVKPDSPDTEQMTLDLEVSYQYVSDVEFHNNKYQQRTKKEKVRKTVSVSCVDGQRQELSMDILNSFGYNAKANIDTSSPAGRAVAEILKNRTEEIETIIGAVSTGEKGSRRLMRDGRWVALYGQWRVGKTVILHEVSRALRGEEFGDQAVTVYAQFGASQDFEEDTVNNICNAMDMISDPEIADLWMDHLDEWEEKHGEITELRSLGRMLGRFHKKIAPKTIVLALDEFTAIYYAIKHEDTDVSFLRNFVDFIGQTGCIILTAGGEHTVRLMTDYDVNMLQKADCRLEVKYLSKEDTAKYVETVITVPSYLGNEAQKQRTINRIFELTQGNAFLLHKFCEALVMCVRANKTLVRIDDIAIQETLDRIVKSEPDVISVYFNSLYNPYNEKKDKRIDGFGNVRDMNLKILEGIVEYAFPETHSCRKDDLSRAFAEEERFEEFLKVLIERAVVKDDGGNLSVPIDLYYEIQSRTKRKDDSNDF